MRPFMILLLLILLASPIQAELIINKYTNDFSLTSPYTQDLKACSCEIRTDEYTVKNTGNFISSYRVTVHSNTDYFTSSITDFSLAQGEELTFLIYAEPGCIEPKKQEYIVQVDSNFGREQSIKKTLDIRKCQNLYFNINETEPTNIADPISFQITVKNVADFQDTFTLDFGKDRVTAGQTQFTLLPDEMRVLNATLIPPKDFSGAYPLITTLTSEKNDVQETKEHIFEIENRYDHALLLDTAIDVCSRVTTKHNVILQNLYDAQNTYQIAVDGPSFVQNPQSIIAADALSEENITLSISPQQGEEGRYTVSIMSTSDFGQIEKQRDLELNVLDCYNFDVSSELLQDTACCGQKEYTLTVHNKGLFEETYNLVNDGPVWFSSPIKTTRLKPNEKTNIQFTADLPCTDEQYDIPIHIVQNSHPDLVQTITFEINSQHQLTCHEVQANIDTVRIDERDAMVPIILSSVGIAAGEYDMKIDSRLYTSIAEDSIVLAPGGQGVIHLNTISNISDYADGRYLSHLTITQDDLEYTIPFWTNFNHQSVFSRAWQSVISYNYRFVPLCIWLVVFLAILTLLMLLWLLMTIANKRFSFQRGVTEETLFTMRMLTATALILTLITLMLVPLPQKTALYQGGLDDSSGLVLEWYENEEYVLDLDHYFNDPDGDALEYTATQPPHIRVVIDGSKATLQPEINWAGQENIVFTATDKKGIFVDSPILLANVLQRTHLNFTQWIMRYCIQVSLGLITLSLIVFLLITLIGITPVVFYPTEHVPKRIFSETPQTRYIAAKSGSKLHLASCSIAQRIPKQEEVIFLSKDVAKKEGYTSCKRCKP